MHVRRLAATTLLVAPVAALAQPRTPVAPAARAATVPLGGPPPGAAPVRLLPEVVPDGKAYAAAFTADGRTLFFTLHDQARDVAEVWTARYDGARWTDAQPASFARGWPSMDPFVAPDGQLYFSWARPRPGMRADTAADHDVWVVARGRDGRWGEPRHVDDAAQSPTPEWYPSVTRDGTLYFDSQRPGRPARRNVWRARRTGDAYGAAEPLPAPVNDSTAGGWNPYVDPDERFIVFGSARTGGHGRGDLWISRRTPDGAWGEPVNLGPRINTPDHEFCPTVSPDGRWFLFSRIHFEGTRRVTDDVYIVSIDVLGGGD